MNLRIVADENLGKIAEIFSAMGSVSLVAGRSLERAHLLECDVLLVRSVTEVNQQLLEGTPVAAVGTATSGMDHMDTSYLAGAGIYQCQAAGANAQSVIDYVLSGIANTGNYLEALLDGGRVGVIGCGRVGGGLSKRLSAMGIACCGYDPLLETSPACRLSSMEEVLRADVIAMHAPLTRDGDYPSYHQMGATELVKLKSGQLLINAGRGATLDNAALLQRLQQAEAPDVLLDVWEGEPEVSRELLKQVELGTPHVAGYSYDGKCRATQMLFEQISEHFSVGSTSADKPLETSLIPVDLPTTLRGAALLRAAINQVYDLRRDDSNLREALVEEESSAKSFDRLRRCYPERHEFSAYSFRESQIKDSADVCLLKGAGFRCLP